jgi:hypothetical protein
MEDYGLDVFDAAGDSVFNADYSTWLIVVIGDIGVGGSDVIFNKDSHPSFNQFTICVGTRSVRTRFSTEIGLTWRDLGSIISIDNKGIEIPWYYIILGK